MAASAEGLQIGRVVSLPTVLQGHQVIGPPAHRLGSASRHDPKQHGVPAPTYYGSGCCGGGTCHQTYRPGGYPHCIIRKAFAFIILGGVIAIFVVLAITQLNWFLDSPWRLLLLAPLAGAGVLAFQSLPS